MRTSTNRIEACSAASTGAAFLATAKIGAQASTEAPEADNIPSKVAPGTMGETKGVTIEKPEEKAEEKKQELRQRQGFDQASRRQPICCCSRSAWR